MTFVFSTPLNRRSGATFDVNIFTPFLWPDLGFTKINKRFGLASTRNKKNKKLERTKFRFCR